MLSACSNLHSLVIIHHCLKPNSCDVTLCLWQRSATFWYHCAKVWVLIHATCQQHISDNLSMSRLKKHSEQFMEKFISFISYLSTGKVNGSSNYQYNDCCSASFTHWCSVSWLIAPLTPEKSWRAKMSSPV